MRHNYQMPPPSQGDRPSRENTDGCGKTRYATREAALKRSPDVYECPNGWWHVREGENHDRSRM